jgi:hypothetical protein
MSATNRRGLTRRSFVRGAALGAAGLAAGSAAADTPAAKPPQLSKADAGAVEALFAGPGARFTEEEKKDIVRLLAAAEKTGAKLHEFPLEENSEPAVIFRVYRKRGK